MSGSNSSGFGGMISDAVASGNTTSGLQNVAVNRSVPKQSQQVSFADRLNAGTGAVGSVVMQGAALVAPNASLSGIASAAASSMAQPAGAVAMPYSGIGSGAGGIATTVNMSGSGASFGGGTGGAVGVLGVPGTDQTIGSDITSVGQNELTEGAGDLNEMLRLQIAVQKEATEFQTISNVLKTRHDTLKNTISNVR